MKMRLKSPDQMKYLQLSVEKTVKVTYIPNSTRNVQYQLLEK